MLRINYSAMFVIGLLGLGVLGAGEPATQPSSPQPAVSSPPAKESRTSNRQGRNRGNRGGGSASVATATDVDPYPLLRTRSIFVKGNQRISDDSAPPSRNNAFVQNTKFSGTAESSLVFNGVIMVSDEANAMIEDTGSHEVSLLKAGDLIAGGKITTVTFDQLTYQAKGKTNNVALGQTLEGLTPTFAATVAAAPTSQPAGAAPPDGSAAVGTPPVGGPPPPPGISAADEILARMKAKRNQELGIK